MGSSQSWQRFRQVVPRFFATGAALVLTACSSAPPASPTATTAPAAKPAAASTTGAAPAAASSTAEWDKIVAAGKQEGQLLIYGRLLEGTEGAQVAETFQKQTGIKVDFISGAGSAMYERVKNEVAAG